MTAALEGGEWSEARPGRTLPPGKTRYPFCRRLGGLQGRSGRAENLVPTGIFFFLQDFFIYQTMSSRQPRLIHVKQVTAPINRHNIYQFKITGVA